MRARVPDLRGQNVLSTGLPLTLEKRLMIYVLHYLKDPKLWELWYIPLLWVTRGFISSTILPNRRCDGDGCYYAAGAASSPPSESQHPRRQKIVITQRVLSSYIVECRVSTLAITS